MAWYAKFDGIDGSSSSAGDTGFIADSFGFGVELEMKESGEKGGTDDLLIGGSTDTVKADYMQYDLTELLVSNVSYAEGSFLGGVNVAVGDVNGDVDGRDYLLWQRGFGSDADTEELAAIYMTDAPETDMGLLLPAVQQDFDLA